MSLFRLNTRRKKTIFLALTTGALAGAGLGYALGNLFAGLGVGTTIGLLIGVTKANNDEHGPRTTDPGPGPGGDA